MNDTPEQFERHMNLNARGGFFTAQAFAKHVGQRNYDASIIFTSSVNAIHPELNNTMYDMTKAAVSAMTKGS